MTFHNPTCVQSAIVALQDMQFVEQSEAGQVAQLPHHCCLMEAETMCCLIFTTINQESVKSGATVFSAAVKTHSF